MERWLAYYFIQNSLAGPIYPAAAPPQFCLRPRILTFNLTDTLTEMAKANLQMKLIGMIDKQSTSEAQQQPSQPHYYQPPPYQASYYPFPPPLPSQPQFRPPAAITDSAMRTSSPLAPLEEEELAIKAFFTWKRGKALTDTQRDRISKAEKTYNTHI